MQTHTVPSLQGTLAKPAKPTLRPNFAKEPFSPSRSNAGQRDRAAKIKRLINGLKNGQLVTSCIVHLADSTNFKGVTSNKRCSGLTGSCFESPNDTIHVTGQHYDDRMSRAFFEELNIPEADINLGIGSGTHAEQVGYSMIEIEKVLIEKKPDWVVVFGDVNAILAASVTAKKLHIKVCHVEAGLRSGEEKMPEEIYRLEN